MDVFFTVYYILKAYTTSGINKGHVIPEFQYKLQPVMTVGWAQMVLAIPVATCHPSRVSSGGAQARGRRL
jgi:hypothetical protein